MAKELTVQGSLQFVKAPLVQVNINQTSVSFDVTGSAYNRVVQTIATTAGGTALNVTGITTPGWFFIRNTDTTHYVTILSAVGGTALLKIKGGEFSMGRFAVAAPAALADTAAVTLEYIIVSD